MMAILFFFAVALLALGAQASRCGQGGGESPPPNIVFLMTDDQDRLLGSMDYMETVQNEMIAKGTEFTQHYTTIAQCCPSRVGLLRGQAAHNTNITNVFAPGGNFEKFVMSGQNDDYLPFWLKDAGYSVEYIGKFLNGHNVLNYNPGPKGWDHIDSLVEPYTLLFNNVVMSENGKTPVAYQGYHQTDVIRAKALSRLEHLTSQDKPFFLALAPTAPHVDNVVSDAVPCQRHMDLFQNVSAPRSPNFKPPDEIQLNAGGILKEFPLIEAGNISAVDDRHRQRLRTLVGIDEMLADILALLDDKGALHNTYVIFTSDNGYHLGNHRMTAGKTTSFAEDTNLPFVVRGPGVPAGVKSHLPGAHIDLAPTFLKIAGVEESDFPPFLDGRSLLEQWHDPGMQYPAAGEGNVQEVLNVEYWGSVRFDYPWGPTFDNATYKSLRIVGQQFGYLYNHWCGTNERELYNTVDDPYEIHNLMAHPNEETKRLVDRLNAMLLVTKSCAMDTCRDPWQILQAEYGRMNSTEMSITSLAQAMDPTYDSFFASLPVVRIEECLMFQEAGNEAPFLPPESASLGGYYRLPTDRLPESLRLSPIVPYNDEQQGTLEQRHVTLEEIVRGARELTSEELDPNQEHTFRRS